MSNRRSRQPDITQPFVDDTTNQAIAELDIQDEYVNVTWGTQINDPNYRQALERMARSAAASYGYDSVNITTAVRATTTGGTHHGRGRGGYVNRVPAEPHFNIEARSTYFPSSNTTLHVNVHVQNPAGGYLPFETNAAQRANRALYPSGYPYQDAVVRSMTMSSRRTDPKEAYRVMYNKWLKKQEKKAQKEAKRKGRSGNWSDDDEGGAAGTAGGSNNSGYGQGVYLSSADSTGGGGWSATQADVAYGDYGGYSGYSGYGGYGDYGDYADQ